MSKRVKEMLMADIRNRIGGPCDLLVVDSSRLDAVTTNKLRLALREKQITALTVQNKLAHRALSDVGLEGVGSLLHGPSTLVWGGEDIVALSKEISKWAKDLDSLEIRGAVVEGQALDAAGVDVLSKSPSREELIGQIVGLALSPGAQLAGALLGPGGTLAGQLEKIADQGEDA